MHFKMIINAVKSKRREKSIKDKKIQQNIISAYNVYANNEQL